MPKFILICLTLAYLPPVLKAETVNLDVLTYNVFQRAPTWLFHDDQDRRAKLIPRYLTGFDVVVLQEAFSDDHRNQMAGALSNEYPYRSDRLGSNEFLSHNGGVIILSKWPIKYQTQFEFDVCDGPDCLVKKGVIYLQFSKQKLTVHLFGLHIQAEQEFGAVRLQQLASVASFIARQKIPVDEPVLIAGDFNVDYFSNQENHEFSQLLDILQVSFSETNPEATYSSQTNSILNEPANERLDYIFYLNLHLHPISSESAVVKIRNDGDDLSDHHGLKGRMVFRLGE